MKGYIELFAKIFGYTHLENEEKQRRSILVLLVILTSLAGTVYSLIYVSMGVAFAINAILFYIGFSGLNLLLYYFLKNYKIFRGAQLVGILLFPTLTHIAIGGFEQSSAVLLAAMLSPLGALMFHNAKAARLFFFLFIMVLCVAALMDLALIDPKIEIPKQIRMLFYVFNIATITAISFFLLAKFVSDSESFKEQLKEKNNELYNEKQKVETALHNLEKSQAQLVQSEKMASLGELTAGIAHEIQNPLNFVNNFAEISGELIEEMVEEISNGNHKEAEALAMDIKNNLEKITHHGKRADGIVKGMIAHSRSGNGQKELTDINALCDEYLRLAYHGLKAKDNSFEASFHFEPDNTLPKVNVVPQDIGRVLLNLINNAFQAVAPGGGTAAAGTVVETGHALSLQQQVRQQQRPTVTLSTKNNGDHIQILVSDNGPGIPDAIKDKIFQPFFTTKPTGQGTGLGLSLSYDIVYAHSGELKVESREGEGSTFIIQLPVITK